MVSKVTPIIGWKKIISELAEKRNERQTKSAKPEQKELEFKYSLYKRREVGSPNPLVEQEWIYVESHRIEWNPPLVRNQQDLKLRKGNITD